MARPKWRAHTKGHAIDTTNVAALKPFRDRSIPVSSLVPCAMHGVEIGELCRSASGKVVSCQSRRRLAIRKLNEQEATSGGE